MKKKIFIVLITIIFLFGGTFKVANADPIDGYQWNNILETYPEITREMILLMYIVGYREGIDYQTHGNNTLTGANGDYLEQISEWYKDPANRKIYALFLMDIANQRFKGKISDKDIPQKLQEFRKLMVELEDPSENKDIDYLDEIINKHMKD